MMIYYLIAGRSFEVVLHLCKIDIIRDVLADDSDIAGNITLVLNLKNRGHGRYHRELERKCLDVSLKLASFFLRSLRACFRK